MLAELLIARLPGATCPEVEQLETLLDSAVARARDEHAGVELADEAFADALAAKLAPDAPLPEALARVRIDALWLATAAAQGDARAIAVIDRLVGAQAPALASFGRDRAFVDEVGQRVRTLLLAGAAPRIRDYAGRGDLGRWIRAAAIRTAIDLVRAGARESLDDDEALLRRATETDDPELVHMKRHYGEAFRAAVRDAIGALDPGARTSLRLYYLDGLTLEQLAGLQRVVASTVWRRLGHARRTVLEHTRRLLRDRLSLGEVELESVLRLIESRFELPESAFAEPSADEDESEP